MSKKSKQAKAREFINAVRKEIISRDNQECIFCKVGYHMEQASWYGLNLKSIMHYIPRSKGGLGIEKNGAVGCQYHHEMLDNGNKGRRKEMIEIFREYLKEQYNDWNKNDLFYKKWT